MRQYLPGYEAYDWKQMSKMTHLEPFTYPVWDREALSRTGIVRVGMMKEEPAQEDRPLGYLLFDYQSRNPLNYEASVTLIGTDGRQYERKG